MKEIIVIGGGVVGLCTAHYAVRQGYSVTVIDREPAAHEGCSYGNAGYVSPSHLIPLASPGMVRLGLKWMWNPESPFYVRPRLSWNLLRWGYLFWRASTPEHVQRCAPILRDLNLASRDCFEEFADLLGADFGLQKKGLLNLCRTEQGLEKEIKLATLARSLGVQAEVLDPKQTAALEPNVQMDIIGSVLFPQDCHLIPGRFMAGLKDQLAKADVEFHWETEVTGWRRNGQQIEAVQTSKGEFDGDEYVICAGAWTAGLANGLQLSLPMQAGKGYSLTLAHPRRMLNYPAICMEARVAVTPMGQSLRFGGTMEIAGMDRRINPARVRGIMKSVPKYFPEFSPEDFEGVQPWCGLRPCSPDGLPYVGRTTSYSNLCVAAGHAMLGFSLGPITGKLIAEVLAGQKPTVDITLLSPDRYSS